MTTKELDNKKSALQSAIALIEKNYGKGSIMKMDSGMIQDNIPVIPTGSLALDIALGVGGIPRGRIIEIFGPESSGKTTICLSILAEAQKMGGMVAFIDAEHAFDPEYAKSLGVNIDDLYISQPDYGEQALEITETLIRSGALSVIIIDSVAALTPKAEIEGDMGDSHMGLQARLMSQALRKITAIASRSQTTIMFTNQIREKIGVFFGNPETTTGGRALKFYSTIRLEIKKLQVITDSGNMVGNKIGVKVVKNKVAPPFKVAEVDIIFGKGISKSGSVLDVAINQGIIEASGAWIKYKTKNIAQGRENAKVYLEENPLVSKEIEEEIYKRLKIKKEQDKAVKKVDGKETEEEAEKTD